MHLKINLGNGLKTIAKKSILYLTLGENHMTEKHKLAIEPTINLKLITGQRKTSKNTRLR